jgi:hypothetical protein
MDNDNLKIWDKVRTPPVTALRSIEGGRLKGKTDINPQWRLQIMTETFGMVGKGWQTKIIDKWTFKNDDGQVVQFIQIELIVDIIENGIRKGVSAPIVGVGAAMLVEQEKAGMHVNEYALKSAYTDALSVAFKCLGVAADIYTGLHDTKRKELQEKWQVFLKTIMQFQKAIPASVFQSILQTYQPLDQIQNDKSKQIELYNKLKESYATHRKSNK